MTSFRLLGGVLLFATACAAGDSEPTSSDATTGGGATGPAAGSSTTAGTGGGQGGAAGSPAGPGGAGGSGHGGAASVSSSAGTGGGAPACVKDTDCVAAQCCHPTTCTPLASAPDCGGIGCTDNCEPGTMDCGQGHCECQTGGCVAVIDGML